MEFAILLKSEVMAMTRYPLLAIVMTSCTGGVGADKFMCGEGNDTEKLQFKRGRRYFRQTEL